MCGFHNDYLRLHRVNFLNVWFSNSNAIYLPYNACQKCKERKECVKQSLTNQIIIASTWFFLKGF